MYVLSLCNVRFSSSCLLCLLDQNVRFTGEEILMLGRQHEALLLPDMKGGFLGTLNVFHELHCVVSDCMMLDRCNRNAN